MKLLFTRISGKLAQIRAQLLTPKFPEIEQIGISVESLGSEYGRKFFAYSELGVNPILVSGGVGEDVTFDVEFVYKYEGKAILFDPTPRAIQHIN
jgi:hypothetical protein